MLEIILTLFIAGLTAGIVFSMPVAGPVSIIIVSKAFQGKLRFCTRTAIGAAIVEFFYVFIVVYGIAALLAYYQPIIPYLLVIGALFVISISIKIIRGKLDFNSLDSEKIITDKMENRGGMRTGIALNATNPSLFISWLIASFITLSFVSSLGFNTGGLDLIINQNVNSVSEITGAELKDLENINHRHEEESLEQTQNDSIPTGILSFVFAFSVALGSLLWLDQLARIIIRYRDKIKVQILNRLIQSLGIILFILGCYIGYRAIIIFMG